MSKMTEQEIKEWDDVYRYLKFEILGYKESMNVPTHMVLKIKEIVTGRSFARLDALSEYNYSYPDILSTLKFYKFKLKQGMASITFNDEIHKFNYICSFIKNHINEVVLIQEKAKKLKAEIEKKDFTHLTETASVDYTTKDKKTDNKNLKKLW